MVDMKRLSKIKDKWAITHVVCNESAEGDFSKRIREVLKIDPDAVHPLL